MQCVYVCNNVIGLNDRVCIGNAIGLRGWGWEMELIVQVSNASDNLGTPKSLFGCNCQRTNVKKSRKRGHESNLL